jgi:hypothetical protein
MRAKFPFSDLHSFKDYLGFVGLCAPDMFPDREGVGPEDKWTLDLAFFGLREGLKLSATEKGSLGVFTECENLVGEAYEAYRAGQIKDGYSKLAQVKKLLSCVPSQ